MTINKKLIALTSLMLINTTSYATPSNDELFQMILDLKKEVAESKNKEIELKSNLDKTKNELIVAKKQLNELPIQVATVKVSAEPQQTLTPNAKEGFTVSAGALVVSGEPAGGYIKNVENYNPGFQISGIYQSKNNWDYALKFKNFTINTDQPVGIYTFAAKTKTELNILDLEIGKFFPFTDNIGLRMAGGIRSAVGTSSETSTIPDYYPTLSKKANYFGIGPRITGTPVYKPFSNEFRIFGNFGASFLMGSTGANYDYSARSLVLEAGSGIGYTFKTNPYNIDLQSGYQLEGWGSPFGNMASGNNFSAFHGPYANVGVKF